MEFLMKYKSIVLLLMAIMLMTAGCSRKFTISRDEEVPASPWPLSRNDAGSRARIDSDFKGELRLIWQKKVSESPAGPLSIGAGKLIFSGTKRRINFYDIKSGKFVGRYKAAAGIQTGLVIRDSLAYFGIGPARNRFVCLNLCNQKILWKVDLSDVTGSPIIIKDYLFVGSSSGEILCLDPLTGTAIWRDSIGSKSSAGPSGDGDIVYFPFDDGKLMGFKVLSGDEIFSAELGQPLITKAVIGDKVYVTGTEGGFFALDKMTGEILWEKTFSYPIWTSPALDEDFLFFGDNGGDFRALNRNDGSTVWEFKTDGVILSSAIVVGQYVIFASLDRFLYCLDKKSGALVSKREFKRGIQFPAVSDGEMICVASYDGTIQCFGD